MRRRALMILGGLGALAGAATAPLVAKLVTTTPSNPVDVPPPKGQRQFVGEVVTEDGAPVAAIAVTIQCDHQSTRAASTGRDGRFRLGPITVAWLPFCFVSVSGPDESQLVYLLVDPLSSIIKARSGGAVVENIRLVVKARRPRIAGRFVDAVGRPMARTLVHAQADVFCDGTRTATMTDGDGHFVFEGLTNSHYNLTADPESLAYADALHVELGRDDVVLRRPPTGRLDGRLLGFPAGTVAVMVSRGHGEKALRISGDRFQVDGAPLGHLTVVAHLGSAFDQRSVHLGPSGVARVVLRPRPLAPIEGVLGEGESLSSSVKCGWALPADQLRQMYFPFPIESTGRFTFEAPAGLDIELRCVEGSAIASTVISHLPRAGEERARLAFTDDDLCDPPGP